ncbi:MAG: AAA family ATPase [Desulfobacterales bacterium]
MEISVKNYTLSKKLYESSNSLVFRAFRNQDGKPVILKMLREARPSPERIAWFRREYEINRKMRLSGIPDIYELKNEDNRWMMVMEDFGGDSLHVLKIAGNTDLQNFLALAVKIAEIVGQIHQLHIIHKDICPANIVLNPAGGQVKIIDFGISTVLSRENQTFCSPGILQGNLNYISPEQTGRMNRAMDYRTDFYSLGISFYELLTGRLPFQSDDPLELIHCHLARHATAPSLLLSSMPVFPFREELRPVLDAVSSIIMKLMAKNAQDRYQSACGLITDLEKCLSFVSEPLSAIGFTPGSQDVSDRFMIPQKLYGRSREISRLLQLFDQTSAGEKHLILVSGEPGVGKSALIQELYRPITEKRAYFLSGKFDQYQRNIPFVAFRQAFRQFCDHLLTQRSEDLAVWKKKILDAVGDSGQVLIDVIPHLEFVIGKQPEIPQVGFQESQNRFYLYFQYFIRAICQPEHPLVIFADDLQWADAASLHLIKVLMSDAQSTNLMIIGAFRDNEVFPGHPLMIMLQEMQDSAITVHRIHVENLRPENVLEMTGDCLHSDAEKVRPLADLICEKTLGNAFFLIQFLSGLYDDGLVRFSREAGWIWDVEKIRSREITDNAVSFMSGKIRKLPPEIQNLLKLASCLGNRFELNVLSHIREGSREETNLHIFECVREGLLIPLDDACKLMLTAGEKTGDGGWLRFVHDRVQQAAYMLMDENLRRTAHLKIGRVMLKNTDPAQLENRIFDIVGHLNFLAEDSFSDSSREEKTDIARLNLTAGKKAMASAAYAAALGYLKTGIGLLGESRWQTHFDLAMELCREAAQAAYLAGDYPEMEQHLADAGHYAKTVGDKLHAIEIRILALQAQNRLEAAIQTGLSGLKELGCEFPENPTPENMEETLRHTMQQISQKGFEGIVSLPEMTDPQQYAVSQLLGTLTTLAIMVAHSLLPLIVCRQIRISLTYGTNPASSFGYVTCGIILCNIANDIASGYRMGRAGLALAQRGESGTYLQKTKFYFHTFIQHWKEHLEETVRPLHENFLSAMEAGLLDFAAYSAANYVLSLFFTGRELTEVEKKTEKYAQAIQNIRQMNVYYWVKAMHQAVQNLLGQSPCPWRLAGRAYEEEKISAFLSAGDVSLQTQSNIYRCMLCYLFGRYQQTVAYARESVPNAQPIFGHPLLPLLYWYESLGNLALFPECSPAEQVRMLETVNSNQQKMKLWADHAPMNHLHKYCLVEAELCRVTGKHGDAREYYDKAIKLAKENEYLQEYALANELAGKFCIEKGLPKIAKIYLREAHYAYRLWGATAKVSHFEKSYRSFLKPKESEEKISSLTSVTGTDSAQISSLLDIASIVKASQAISEKIILNDLLRKLMSVMMENAGAQKGFLLLERGGHLHIEAESGREEQPLKGLTPEEAGEHLSQAIVNFAFRTHSSVVLNDAANEGEYMTDWHVSRYRPKSVLCMPIVGRGHCLGVLYLENSLSTHGFPKERLEILGILAVQAAISIENARLYASLEQRVTERTVQLEKANQKLEESREMFSTFMDYLPAPAFVKDDESRTLYVNRYFKDLFGNEWEGKSVMELFPEPVAKAMMEDDRRALAQGMVQNIETVPDRYGGNRIFQTLKFRLGNSSRIGGFGIDVTELKQAKEAAEIANRAKSEFLANMSHEIRTPMNALVNMTRLLLDTELDGEQRDYAETAVMSSEILLSLINDILDFSKIEAGKLDLEKSDFSLRDILESAVRILRPKAEEKGLRVTHRLDPNLPSHVSGDPVRVRQILLNFLNNAVKFTKKGDIAVRVLAEDQTETHCTVRFEVADTGAGIPEKLRNRMFQPFSQADSSTTRKYGGTGLGLAISRQIAELMGGTVSFESEEGRGSTFRFTARMRKAERKMSDDECRTPREADRFSIHGAQSDTHPPLHILVAEDNVFNQKVVSAILKKFDLAADIAENGRETVDALRSRPYDLVFMDIQMPEMDGLTAARTIRDPDSGVLNPCIPIIAMTANATKEDRRKCLEAGMNDYIPKPIDPEKLISVIREQLSVKTEPCLSKRDSLKTETCSLSAEIFNRADFLRRLGGDEGIMRRILSGIPENLAGGIRKLRSAAEENDAEKIQFYAHSIRGISANISAERIRDAACEIENAGKKGETDTVRALTDRLEREADAFRSVISAMFPELFQAIEKSEHAQESEMISEQTGLRIPELIRMLENNLLPEWEKCKDIFFIDETEKFAAQLKCIGTEYQLGFLIRYSRELHAAVQNYNFTQWEKRMSEFPQIVSRIRKLAENGPISG